VTSTYEVSTISAIIIIIMSQSVNLDLAVADYYRASAERRRSAEMNKQINSDQVIISQAHRRGSLFRLAVTALAAAFHCYSPEDLEKRLVEPALFHMVLREHQLRSNTIRLFEKTAIVPALEVRNNEIFRGVRCKDHGVVWIPPKHKFLCLPTLQTIASREVVAANLRHHLCEVCGRLCRGAGNWVERRCMRYPGEYDMRLEEY